MIPTLTQFTLDYAGGLALFAGLADLFWSLGCALWFALVTAWGALMSRRAS